MWPGEQTMKAYNESKVKMPKAITGSERAHCQGTDPEHRALTKPQHHAAAGHCTDEIDRITHH
jgi:hypothetical protein